MPDRDSIHKLVDSLPEEALETAERLLRSGQTWQPAPTLDVPAMRRRVREMFMRGLNEHGMKVVKELESKHESKGGKSPLPLSSPETDRSASWFAVEGETLVTYRICRRQGHELEIEERFRISEDKSKLQYSQQVQGPQGRIETYKIDFDCP